MSERNSVTPDATAIADMIRRKEISALEAIDAAIARAERLQPALNFLVTPMFEAARARAASQTLAGPFAGVPYLVKDMYDIRGVPTRWGARFTEHAPLPRSTCTQVKAFEAAGLVIIGKSALGEFGWIPSTEPLAFGPTRNPWNLERTPGGSSGGSAAAVAAGVLPMADAADGGGSIRIPASACGLFGLKPSRGRLAGDQHPAGGIEIVAEHCVSRSVRDSAGLFAAMERRGAKAPFPPVRMVKEQTKRRLRVGFVTRSIGNQEPDSDVLRAAHDAAALLEGLGHRVEHTNWPIDGDALVADFRKLYCAAALEVVNVARLAINPRALAVLSLALAATGLWRGGFGRKPDTSDMEPFTFAMADEARALPKGELANAALRLAGYEAAYAGWFAHHDVILSPVLLQPPVPIGWIAGDVDTETLLRRIFAFADYTLVHNIVGAPAMSVPLSWSPDGLPIGMQFAARAGDDRTLLELAYELEEAQPWAHRRPPVFAENDIAENDIAGNGAARVAAHA